MSEPEAMLFTDGPERLPEPEPENATTRRRARQAVLMGAGYHPLAGPTPEGRNLRLLGPNSDGDGHTCGDCAHRYIKRMGGDYPKCELGPNTGGPATDVLARWPACTRWQAKPAP